MEIHPYYRVILLKHVDSYSWSIQTNPTMGQCERALSNVLINAANEYCEFKNCGVLHRMIRFDDIDKYFDNINEFKIEWALDPYVK